MPHNRLATPHARSGPQRNTADVQPLVPMGHPHVGQHRRTRETRSSSTTPSSRSSMVSGDSCAARLAGRRRWFEIRRREIRRRGGRRERLALAAGVAAFLRPSSVRRAVVRRAPLVGALPAAVLSATERTTQVPPACVAGMREKANPAVLAVNNALPKSGMGLQNRIQRRLILPDNRLGAIVLMPIHLEREKLLDGDDKKARLSVIIPIELDTPSSYPIDAKASRSRARFFCASDKNLQERSAPTIQAASLAQAIRPAETTQTRRALYLEITT